MVSAKVRVQVRARARVSVSGTPPLGLGALACGACL